MNALSVAPPSNVYDRLRRIHVSALALDEYVHNHVTDATLRDAWSTWLAGALSPYHAKYAGPDASEWTKLKALLYPSDLARQVENLRAQLEDFHRSYSTQRTPAGDPLPQLSIPAPTLANIPPVPAGMPLWTWALMLFSVGAISYAVYLQVRGQPAAGQRDRTRR